MGQAKAAHHRGTHQVRARRLVQAGYANPAARCWRCGRTLAQVREAKPKAIWTAGHTTDGQVGGHLALECSPCNFGWGARLGNALRRTPKHTSVTW